jgi:hypothetical protein
MMLSQSHGEAGCNETVASDRGLGTVCEMDEDGCMVHGQWAADAAAAWASG